MREKVVGYRWVTVSGNNVEEAKQNWLNGYTFNEHDIEPISVELTRIEDENENVFEIKG